MMLTEVISSIGEAGLAQSLATLWSSLGSFC